MLQVGTKVRIKSGTFDGNNEPSMQDANGKYGVISDITSDLISVDIHGFEYPCTAEELEELPDGMLLYDDYEAIVVTDRYKAALIELLAAKVEMMVQSGDPESWYYGRVTVGNLANSRNLEFEYGGKADMPDDGLGQFGVIIE